MHNLAFIFGLLLSQTILFAQGYVVFANRYSNTNGVVVDAPVVKHLDPQWGPGPEWTAQLFLKENDSLSALFPLSTFRPLGITAIIVPVRYWFSQTNEVPGILPGQSATFIVRAWKTSLGSYEAASALGYVGESLPVTITVGDALNPAPLIGLQQFEVGPFALRVPTLTIASALLPLTFSVQNSGARLNTIETSADLQSWRPYLSVSSKLDTFRVIDPSPAPLRESGSPGFFRLRLVETLFPSLPDWQSRGISHYRFRFERSCFCRSFSLSGTVEVENGRIIAVTDARADHVPESNPDVTQFKTIEDLFALIQNDSARADLLVAAHDPVFLYPRVIDIDYLIGAADDEITYYGSELQPLP